MQELQMRCIGGRVNAIKVHEDREGGGGRVRSGKWEMWWKWLVALHSPLRPAGGEGGHRGANARRGGGSPLQTTLATINPYQCATSRPLRLRSLIPRDLSIVYKLFQLFSCLLLFYYHFIRDFSRFFLSIFFKISRSPVGEEHLKAELQHILVLLIIFN